MIRLDSRGYYFGSALNVHHHTTTGESPRDQGPRADGRISSTTNRWLGRTSRRCAAHSSSFSYWEGAATAPGTDGMRPLVEWNALPDCRVPRQILLLYRRLLEISLAPLMSLAPPYSRGQGIYTHSSHALEPHTSVLLNTTYRPQAGLLLISLC